MPHRKRTERNALAPDTSHTERSPSQELQSIHEDLRHADAKLHYAMGKVQVALARVERLESRLAAESSFLKS